MMLLVLWLMTTIGLNAQNITGERRIYYLDATYSMVSNKLWEPSKNNLIKAIENIEDINTEIVVVVFADDINPTKKVWKKWETKATTTDKEKLIANINGLANPVRSSMTNLYDPWIDFYSEIKPKKVNYMFLMTDGGHEQGGDFWGAIDQWKNRTNSITYGFFVELTENVGTKEIVPRNKARKHIDNQKGRLWRVSTADVNINLIRLEQSITFNVRNDKYVDIPIFFSGKDKSVIKKLKFEVTDNSDFKIRKVDIKDNAARVYIDKNIDIHSYPTNSEIPLTILLNDTNDKTFLLTSSIDIKCLNEKEKVLFLSNNRITGKVKHSDSFGWVKANTTPCNTTIDLEFNKDALNDPDCFVEFIVVDNNGKVLPSSSVIFAMDGITCNDNKFIVRPTEKNISFSISFPDGTKSGVHQGYLKPINYNLDRIGNIALDNDTTEYPITWRVKYIHAMNPLAKAIMWICILTLSALLLWFLLLKPINYPRFPKFRKMVLVKKNDIVVAQFTVNFKGARRVVFANKKQHQGFLNKLFTGRIDTIVKPEFEEPITFIPKKRKKAMIKGKGYLINPNPIPQSGVAEISSPIKKLIINLQ